MYTAVKGVYENGQIRMIEPAPTTEKSAVIITFIGKEAAAPIKPAPELSPTPGFLKKWGEGHGQLLSIPDDFNEPIDDLADYM